MVRFATAKHAANFQLQKRPMTPVALRDAVMSRTAAFVAAEPHLAFASPKLKKSLGFAVANLCLWLETCTYLRRHNFAVATLELR